MRICLKAIIFQSFNPHKRYPSFNKTKILKPKIKISRKSKKGKVQKHSKLDNH